jgi:hypothetical protein
MGNTFGALLERCQASNLSKAQEKKRLLHMVLATAEVAYHVSSFKDKHKHCLHASSSCCKYVVSCGAFPVHDAAHGAFVTFPCHTNIREVSISSDEVQCKQKERS